MPAFKKIKEYSKEELDHAVEIAVKYCNTCGFNFFTILNGVDAYLERRKRKEELEQASKDEKHDKEFFSSQD